MACRIHETREDFIQNTFKLHLAILITREGIEEIVECKFMEFHARMLASVRGQFHLPGDMTCTSCTTANVVPCFTPGFCYGGRGRCRLHNLNYPETWDRKCPRRMCNYIQGAIRRCHTRDKPAWTNTDATEWCNDYFEVFKCFLPHSLGYKRADSLKSVDLYGMIFALYTSKVISPNTHIQIFSEVLDVLNCTRHSLDVPDVKLEHAIRLFNMCLRPWVTENKKANRAVDKLKKDNRPAVLQRFDFLRLLNRGNDIALLKEDVRSIVAEEAVQLLLQDNPFEELKKQMQLQDNQSTDREPERYEHPVQHKACSVTVLPLNDYISQEQLDEIEEQSKDLTEKEYIYAEEEFLKQNDDDSGTSKCKICCEKKVLSIVLPCRHCYCQECLLKSKVCPFDREDIELTYVIARMKGKSHNWSTSIDTRDEDMAKHLLEEGILPTNYELQKAFSEFGNKSPIIKYICERIEEWLIDSSENVVDVKACYKYTRPMKVVFVVFPATGKHYEIDDKCQYPIEVRRQSSHEANKIIDLEVHGHLHFDKAEMDIISQCLRDESPGLMKKHSNLNMTSASHYKSSEYGYGNKNTKITCIVFYVSAKGFIPVGEDILPPEIGSFKTDVREGRFVLSGGGGPGSKHKNIKIGCQISCNDSYGTVGGFVQHPRLGLCAMTCAHTLLTIEEFEQLYERGNLQLISRGQYEPEGAESPWLSRECHQPGEPDKMGTLVDAIACPGDKETAGLDIAFVEVDKSRHPVTGEFPDFKRPKQSSICLHSKGTFNESKLKFKDGSVFERDEIPSTNTAVKYGATTTFTSGTLQVHGSSVRPELNEDVHLQGRKKKHSRKKNKILKYTLHDQINIFSCGSDFSENGDSGSLVMSMCEENALVAFGVLTGGGKDNKISFATPLSNILERIGLSRPFSLVYLGNEKRLENLELSVEEFSKQTEKNFDDLHKKIDDKFDEILKRLP